MGLFGTKIDCLTGYCFAFMETAFQNSLPFAEKSSYLFFVINKSSINPIKGRVRIENKLSFGVSVLKIILIYAVKLYENNAAF